MSDDDTLIRDRLAAAAGVDVLADPRGVREGVARRRRRIRRRRRGAAAAVVVACAGFVGAGLALTWDRDPQPDGTVQADAPDQAPTSSEAPSSSEAPTTSEVPGASDAPKFLPAPGWEVRQIEFGSTAANIPLGPYAGSDPWDTVEQLGPDDVALHVTASPMGGSAAMDENTPPGELPISVDDMSPNQMEGDPGVGLSLRTTVQVNGWNLDLMVFFGTAEPSAETRAEAQEQLARLDVPARTVRPLDQPPEDACQPTDLNLVLDVEEAAGVVRGRIRVRNDGDAPCTLEGLPHIELRDPTASGLDVIPMTASEAPPAWQQADADAPEGWPAIRVDAGSEVQAVLTLRNWCLGFVEPFVFVRLPYHVDRIGGDAPTMPAVPACDDPQQPPELAIGPLEPPRTTG